MDPNIPRILSFWFDHPDPVTRWFMPSATIDREIRDQFGSLVGEARSTKLDSWTHEPDGTLALLLLLDQFPRNIFRGSPESYSSDAKALDVSTRAIAKGFDRQIASEALYENCARRCGADAQAKKLVEDSGKYGKLHLDVIARFGRYPSRNKVLGRASTKAEDEFLEENPSGFDESR